MVFSSHRRKCRLKESGTCHHPAQTPCPTRPRLSSEPPIRIHPAFTPMVPSASLWTVPMPPPLPSALVLVTGWLPPIPSVFLFHLVTILVLAFCGLAAC